MDNLLRQTYYHSKQAAQEYQIAKAALFDKFQANNYGTWVKKPMEQELFGVDAINGLENFS